MQIPFNQALVLGEECDAIADVMANNALSSGGGYTRFCEQWLEDYVDRAFRPLLRLNPSRVSKPRAMSVGSCTQALELAALLIDIRPGDEVIMPSWTFTSTANAFVLRGATPVFIDINPATCNIDISLIEAAITPRTKAIIPVHYAGISCDMTSIMAIAAKYSVWVIEDAAQGLMSTFKKAPLGAIGHLGAYSFHSTKNYTSGGEGGVLMINDPQLLARAQRIRDHGTNRQAFASGEVDRYQWVDLGSSFYLSELQSAALSVQLRGAAQVNERRRTLWDRYYNELKEPCDRAGLSMPVVPAFARHNGHLFYLRTRDRSQRDNLQSLLEKRGVAAHTHYVPLHLSPAGKRFGRFVGSDRATLAVHESLLRLPLYYSLTERQQNYVIDSTRAILRTF